MNCPKCGKENTGNATFCQHCGAQIGSTAPSAIPQTSPPAQKPTSGFAITSLVLGIVGFLIGWFSFFITAIPTVVFGHLARGKIKRADGAIGGDGMAIAGLILGYIQVVLFGIMLLGIIVAISIPAYQDYTLRSKVQEAFSQSYETRTAIVNAIRRGHRLGEIPTTPGALGLKSPEDYRTKYVASISYNADGVVTIRFKQLKSLGGAAGKTLVYRPEITDGDVSWVIDPRTTLPSRYRPSGISRDSKTRKISDNTI